MEIPPVDLDDQLLGLEVEVDLVAVDLGVDLRARKLVFLAEGKEEVLELGTGRTGGFGLREPDSFGAPGWVGQRMRRSVRWCGFRSLVLFASLTTLVRRRSVRLGVQSSMVRAGLVMRMPCRRRTSRGSSVLTRWARIPLGLRSSLTTTSSTLAGQPARPQRARAGRWESAAVGPQARTAAEARSSAVWGGRPTA